MRGSSGGGRLVRGMSAEENGRRGTGGEGDQW